MKIYNIVKLLLASTIGVVISACVIIKKDKLFVDGNRILSVSLYHKGLYTTTKLSVDTLSIISKVSYLSRIDNMFVVELDSSLREAHNVDRNKFSYERTRACYVVKMVDSQKNIFIDSGGNYIIYNNLVYKIDSSVASVIVKYLPKDSSEVHGATNKRFYNREVRRGIYTPFILRYGS